MPVSHKNIPTVTWKAEARWQPACRTGTMLLRGRAWRCCGGRGRGNAGTDVVYRFAAAPPFRARAAETPQPHRNASLMWTSRRTLHG